MDSTGAVPRPWKDLRPATDPPILCPLATKLGVGFGDCYVSRDGVRVWEEPPKVAWSRLPRLHRFERQAGKESSHDWRVVFSAPLSYAEYQRQGPGRWVLVKTGLGFA